MTTNTERQVYLVCNIQVVYATDQATAHRACCIKAAALEEMGIKVHFCGNVDLKDKSHG